MNRKLKSALAVTALIAATHAAAQVTFYEGEGFRGRAFTTNAQVGDFGRAGFNDRASSVVVDKGRWEVCEHARFQGRCVVLRRGNYESLARLGMENSISSVRPADNRRRFEEPAAQLEAGGGEAGGGDVDRAFLRDPQGLKTVVAVTDDAADERWLKVNHHVPGHGHDVGLVLPRRCEEHNRPRFEQAVHQG